MKIRYWGVIVYLALSTVARATVYPWLEVNRDDLRVIPNARIEAGFRLDLIQNAQRSIDLVTWEQDLGRLGYPVLRELKNAADRGVRIRFLVSWVGHLVQSFNAIEPFLNNPPPVVPIEFLVVGGRSMRSKGWGFLDGIHEKLLVVDDRIGFLTGRGHAYQYLRWLDTGFAFKGPVVAEAKSAFDSLWNTVHQESTWQGIRKVSASPTPASPIEVPHLTPVRGNLNQRRRLQDLKDWAARPSATLAGEGMGNDVQIRFLHFDFIHQMRMLADRHHISPNRLPYSQRLNELQDPFVQELVALSADPNVTQIQINTLSVSPHPRLRDALEGAARRGVDVQILTNGRVAQDRVMPFSFSFPLGWFVSLPDMIALLENGVRVFGFAQRSPDAPVYLHRKVAIVGESVFLGSHNFNFSSSVESDEMGFEIRSREFAHEVRELFGDSIRRYSEEIRLEDVTQERKSSRIRVWISSFFKGLY